MIELVALSCIVESAANSAATLVLTNSLALLIIIQAKKQFTI
jgi:hypothetical protein